MGPAPQPSHNDAAPVMAPLVLLVEDEPLLRMVMADQLRETGFAVVEARSGDEARILVQSGVRPDAMISDMRMPGTLDGAALTRWVWSHIPDLPVMIVSGESPRHDLSEATFVGKPFAMNWLTQWLLQALARA